MINAIMVDYIVTYGLLNPLAMEIVDDFLFISPARGLWNELYKRYREFNGPQLYQLQ